MLQQGTYNVSRERSTVKIENCAEGDHNAVSSLGDTSANNNNNMSKCRALVTVPAINMDALAVVPYRRKSGNSDFGQRRIRRPFSVLEVEALVQAVEKLGTGRFVQHCFFFNELFYKLDSVKYITCVLQVA
jgi:hypothetical protein